MPCAVKSSFKTGLQIFLERLVIWTTDYIGIEMKLGECVSALSAGAYTATLYVMVNIVKGVGVHPPTLTSLG